MFSHYLMFNNNCGEALKVYSNAFGAEIKEVQTYGDMPPNPNFPIKDADKNKVLHARLKWGDTELMCADASDRAVSGSNMYISVTLKNIDAVKKAWDILSENAKIYMDLQPSFFALAHGSLCDKFGVNWMFTVPK